MKYKANFAKYLGLFGGSFNPPHFGHVQVSATIVKRLKLSRILWLVVPENPFKKGQDYLPQKTRIELCKKLIKNLEGEVIDFESDLKSFETVETVKKALKSFPNSKLFWIMGSDSLASFHKWRGADFIAKNVQLVVFARKGIHKSLRSKANIRYKPIVVWSKMMNVSSTQIRENLGTNWKNKLAKSEKLL
jgi:nicotinate-nucleotide adenylyltransferase